MSTWARLLDRSEAARLGTAAGLLALSFPPLPFGLVALVALTPLLSVLDGDPRAGFRRGFLQGAFFGSLFYLVLLFWFWDLIRFTPLILPSWFLTALWQGALMGLAMSSTSPSDAGLASGLINTTAQVGGALGLAVLATLSTTHSEHLAAGGSSSLAALTGGYRLAFVIATALAAIATVVAARMLDAPAPSTVADAVPSLDGGAAVPECA